MSRQTDVPHGGMPRWADLHCHSRISDGSYSPQGLVRLARARGLSVLSITDHDTSPFGAGGSDGAGWQGWDELREQAAGLDVRLIPGAEISARDGKRRIHLLAYWPEGNTADSHVEALCSPTRSARDEMTRSHIQTLTGMGLPICVEDVEAEAQGGNSGLPAAGVAQRDGFTRGFFRVLYKQHIMSVLLQRGLADSMYGEFYKQHFKGGGPCDRDIDYPDIRSAVAAVVADGALPVLAHPGLQDSFDLVAELAELGLWGIELNHEAHDERARHIILGLAKKHDLFLTGGSDYHGEYGGATALGDIVAPAAFFSAENPLL